MAVVEWDYAQLGAAWQRSRLPALPASLTWRNHAKAPDDPQRALDDADARLKSYGLIDRRGGLDDDLYGMLALFAQAPCELDMRFAADAGHEARVVAAARGRYAARAIVDGDFVRLETVADYQATGSLVGVLPEVQAARGPVVSLPTSELAAAVAEVSERGDDSDGAFVSALRARGVRSDDARNLVALLGGDRTGFGQIGAAARDSGGRRHRSPVAVQVIDTCAGRSAVYQRAGYTVTSPADFPLLVRVVDELLAGTRRRL